MKHETTFTDQTWADLGGRGVTRKAPSAWTRLHDLAIEAHEARDDLDLPFEAYRDLVSAAANGLPIIIRHRNRGGSETTRTYIIEQFMTYRGGTYANLFVRAWGFSFPIALSEVVSVQVPEQEFHSEALIS